MHHKTFSCQVNQPNLSKYPYNFLSQVKMFNHRRHPLIVGLLPWDQRGIHIHHSRFDRRRDFAEVMVNIAEKYRNG